MTLVPNLGVTSNLHSVYQAKNQLLTYIQRLESTIDILHKVGLSLQN